MELIEFANKIMIEEASQEKIAKLAEIIVDMQHQSLTDTVVVTLIFFAFAVICIIQHNRISKLEKNIEDCGQWNGRQ